MSSIMTVIWSFWACGFNIYGLLFYMTDTKKVTDVLKAMNLKAKICSVITIIAVSVCVMRTGICLFTFITIEYIGFLIWYKKQGKECIRPAFRGIIIIIESILIELLLLFVYYHRGIGNLQYTGQTRPEMRLACYLGMALVQCALIILREVRRMSTGYRKGLMIALAAKTAVDVLWLYLCAYAYAFEYSHVVVPLLFILELLVDYHAFCIMVLKIEERDRLDKRADIHTNAYEYYLNMEEEHLRIRKMYHEMKNQLMIMKEGGEDFDVEHLQYGENVQKKLEKMNQFYHTGIVSLDMLLFDGKKKAEARNIDFEAVIEDGCLSFMDVEDVNIIFSNAIINAIEACEKIVSGPRQIKIKAGKNLGDTLIYVKNTVSQDREKGSLSTNKKNRKMHGIGLTSIQECVERYNGYVSIIEENSTFQLAILFGKE